MAGSSVGTYYCTVVPSMKGFAKEMNSQLSGISMNAAGKSMGSSLSESIASSIDTSGIASKISGAFQSAGSAMASVGTALTVGITGAFSAAGIAAGKFALDVASSAETSEMAFTTMLGSAEAAKDMMSDLADFAAKTPFEFSGLVSSTQQLLAYGFAAEDVLPMLTAVGDATAALGTGQYGIEAVTRALGQMSTRGKVSAEEMLQLTEQGIPAWEYLARTIGTDTAGAMDAVSKGAVSASDGIAALTKGMEEDFGGMMASQATTLTGIMSNLSDAIEKPLMQLKDTEGYDALTDSLSGLVDKVSPLVESALPMLSDALSGAAGMVDFLSDAVGRFGNSSGMNQIKAVVQAFLGLGPAITVAGTALMAASPLMDGIGASASAFSKGMSTVLSSADKLPGALSKVSTFLKQGGIGDMVETVGSSAKKARSGLVSLYGGLQMVAGGMQDPITRAIMLDDALRSIGPAASAAGTGLMNGVSAFGPAIVSSLSSVGTVISGATLAIGALAVGIGAAAAIAAAGGMDFQAFGQGLSASILDVGSMATSAIQGLTDAIPQAVAGVQQAAPMIINAVLMIMQQVGAAIMGFLPQFGVLVQTIVPYICQLLVEAAPMLLAGALQFFGSLLTGLSQIVPQIMAYMPTFIQGITGALVANIPSLIMGAVQFFSAIVQAIPQVIPQIAAAIPQITQSICSVLPQAIPELISAATQFLVGIVQAVPQALPSILAAIGELASSICSNLPTYVGQLLAAAVELFMAIAQAVPQVVGEVLAAIGDLLQSVWDAITSFDLASAGVQLIQGFVNGIGSMAGAVVDAVTGVVGGAIEAAKNFLGIASPSKVFMEIGDYTMQGLAVGIAGGASLAAKSMQDAMAEVYGTASGASVRPLSMSTGYVGEASSTWPRDINQTINFNQPMQTPSQVAYAMKRYATYGLAGAR